MQSISDQDRSPAVGSLAWVEEAQRAVADLRVSHDALLRIKSVVDDDNETHEWWLDIADGMVRVGSARQADPQRDTGTQGNTGGEARNEAGDVAPQRTVTFTMNRATAESVRTGELGALDAIQTGAISIAGDTAALAGASEALAAVNRALAGI